MAGALHTWVAEGEPISTKSPHQIIQLLCYSDFCCEIGNKPIPESIHLLLQLNNPVLLGDSKDVLG